MSNIVSNQLVSKRDKEVNFKNVGGSNVQRGMGTDINYDIFFFFFFLIGIRSMQG